MMFLYEGYRAGNPEYQKELEDQYIQAVATHILETDESLWTDEYKVIKYDAQYKQLCLTKLEYELAGKDTSAIDEALEEVGAQRHSAFEVVITRFLESFGIDKSSFKASSSFKTAVLKWCKSCPKYRVG